MTLVWPHPGDPPQSFADYVAEVENRDARDAQLLAAIVRLRSIETQARTNPGLRGPDPWTPPQQRAIIDGLADVTQAVRWLVQQQVATRDPAD